MFVCTHIDGEKIPFTLQSADVFLFHTPYCKLVQKSLARLMLNDYLSDKNPDFDGVYAGLERFRYVSVDSARFYLLLCVNFDIKPDESLYVACHMYCSNVSD